MEQHVALDFSRTRAAAPPVRAVSDGLHRQPPAIAWKIKVMKTSRLCPAFSPRSAFIAGIYGMNFKVIARSWICHFGY